MSTGLIPTITLQMDVKLGVLWLIMEHARRVTLQLPVDVLLLRAISTSLMPTMMRPTGAKLVALLLTVFVPRVQVLLPVDVQRLFVISTSLILTVMLQMAV